MRAFFGIAAAVCFVLFAGHARADDPLPRVVIALYNGGNIQESYIHTVAEMSLNHLGLIVEYHDIHEPLPAIADRKDVRGVLTWFMSNSSPLDAKTYFKWASDAVSAGKKFVILGSPGTFGDSKHYVDPTLEDKFLSMLGLKITDHWVDRPFDVTYQYETPKMFFATNLYEYLRPPYAVVHSISDESRVHLRAHSDKAEDDSDLIITGPHGGYVADGYIFRTNTPDKDEVAQWLINPFEFFRVALDTDELPKPDVTTIAGRRLYYSSIDGDGWNNITQLEEFRGKNVLSAWVVMDRAIKPYPDMPVTLSVIGADVDPDWAALKDSRAVAQEFLALPQVEAGSHTYSHPFDWQFFEDGNTKKEIPFLSLYPNPAWKPDPEDAAAAPKTKPVLPNGYIVPRAYAHEPFDIHKEIAGSIKEIAGLLPPGKKVQVLAWSGNCSPWADVIRMTREAHVQNINGGDSRFDPEYPGYASEEPIGKQVGNEWQIYNPTSNEDLYTNQWSENFNAFEYLKVTLKNSETPIRLEPIGIYYHIYSGEKEASLKALVGNIEYARRQEITPVTVSHYARIAEGFYTTTLTRLAPDTWRVDNRGSLQTIRFDHASVKSVDFARSKGVVGQRYLQGSLYVYLDKTADRPVISLKNNDTYFDAPKESVPYLVSSRWTVSDVHYKKNGLDFSTRGFGDGEMVWRMPAPGVYRVNANGKMQNLTARDGLLTFKLAPNGMDQTHVTVRGS